MSNSSSWGNKPFKRRQQRENPFRRTNTEREHFPSLDEAFLNENDNGNSESSTQRDDTTRQLDTQHHSQNDSTESSVCSTSFTHLSIGALAALGEHQRQIARFGLDESLIDQRAPKHRFIAPSGDWPHFDVGEDEGRDGVPGTTTLATTPPTTTILNTTTSSGSPTTSLDREWDRLLQLSTTYDESVLIDQENHNLVDFKRLSIHPSEEGIETMLQPFDNDQEQRHQTSFETDCDFFNSSQVQNLLTPDRLINIPPSRMNMITRRNCEDDDNGMAWEGSFSEVASSVPVATSPAPTTIVGSTISATFPPSPNYWEVSKVAATAAAKAAASKDTHEHSLSQLRPFSTLQDQSFVSLTAVDLSRISAVDDNLDDSFYQQVNTSLNTSTDARQYRGPPVSSPETSFQNSNDWSSNSHQPKSSYDAMLPSFPEPSRPPRHFSPQKENQVNQTPAPDEWQSYMPPVPSKYSNDFASEIPQRPGHLRSNPVPRVRMYQQRKRPAMVSITDLPARRSTEAYIDVVAGHSDGDSKNSPPSIVAEVDFETLVLNDSNNLSDLSSIRVVDQSISFSTTTVTQNASSRIIPTQTPASVSVDEDNEVSWLYQGRGPFRTGVPRRLLVSGDANDGMDNCDYSVGNFSSPPRLVPKNLLVSFEESFYAADNQDGTAAGADRDTSYKTY